MPHERAVVDTSARLGVSGLLEAGAGAGEVVAVGKDVHGHDDASAIRRNPERADVERQIRDLLAFAAGGGQSPHLR
jgi:hypothetical protein